jgi:hypothetical protein
VVQDLRSDYEVDLWAIFGVALPAHCAYLFIGDPVGSGNMAQKWRHRSHRPLLFHTLLKIARVRNA